MAWNYLHGEIQTQTKDFDRYNEIQKSLASYMTGTKFKQIYYQKYHKEIVKTICKITKVLSLFIPAVYFHT